MRRALRIVIGIIVAGGLVAAGAGWYLRERAPAKPVLRTAQVKRGDIRATISATGTVEPEEVVDVGAQVAGQIVSFGKDDAGKAVDYGSVVEAGAVLANIDSSLYAADVKLAEASMAAAKASRVRADADLVQMKAKLDQAQRDWDRAQKLGPSEALAPTQYDAYRAGYEIAKANVAVGEAAIEQATAAVGQAEASLNRVNRNLSYCTITSPVKGVVIDRRVNIGQTVVSSLNAPSLFLLAKDLNRVQVWVSVNEADIGNIAPGMPATFTVDALPGRTFTGTVGKTRLNATMTQNVVTYTVEVTTDNPDGKLLPYLTATVLFETGAHRDVLIVPGAALRWSPRPEMIAPQYRGQAAAALAGAAGARAGDAATRPAMAPPRNGPSSDTAAGRAGGRGESRRGVVWVLENEFVRPIGVRTGINDGVQTEVQGPDLAEGMAIVTGEQMAAGNGGGAVSGGGSPFTPQLGRARRPANDSGGPAGPDGGAGGAGGGGPGGR